MEGVREFAPGDIARAAAFMRELEGDYERVYIEEEDQPGEWRFVFGDQIRHARLRLARVRVGARFRVRAVGTLSDSGAGGDSSLRPQ
jgi:hypothetical protein